MLAPLTALLLAGCVSVPVSWTATPAQGRAIELERLVLSCDRIVRAAVSAIHDLPAREPTRLLELTVEEVYWGEPEQKVLFVLDDTHFPALHDHGALTVGDDSIWFLEHDPLDGFLEKVTREKLEHFTGAAGYQVVGLWGRARLHVERKEKDPTVCLLRNSWVIPDSLAVVGEHSTKHPDRDWDEFRGVDFERWLRSTIAASVPSIEAVWSWTAPGTQPVITIDKLGHAVRSDSYMGNKQLEIGSEGLRAALLSAEREHFFELPVRIGNSLGPDSNSFLLRVRTEKGGHQIRLEGPADPKQDSPAQLEAHARAMRVWNAIPLARDWKIPGH